MNGEARSFGCGMEGTSSDTEKGRFSSDDEGEHNVENLLHAVLVCASCVQSSLARILTRRRAV